VRTVLGEEGLDVGMRTMGSEDAAFFLREIPGCFFFVGSTPVDAEEHIPHHNPKFDIDESVLPIGVSVMLTSLRRLMPVEEA
jgi:amidohydrolase